MGYFLVVLKPKAEFLSRVQVEKWTNINLEVRYFSKVDFSLCNTKSFYVPSKDSRKQMFLLFTKKYI